MRGLRLEADMSGPALELKDTMVRAGAGAGKTRGLVDTVVEIYRRFRTHGRLPRVALTTFTRKATQELKERLVARACDERDPDLLQFVTDPSRLQLSTIHGLLSIFLRQVGHLAGLDSGFRLITEAEGARFARMALRDCLVDEPARLEWLERYGFDRVLALCRRYDANLGREGRLRPASLADLEECVRGQTAEWRDLLLTLANEIASGPDDSKWREYTAELAVFATNWSGSGPDLENLPTKPARSKKRPDLEPWHDRVDEVIKPFKLEMQRPAWDPVLWPQMAAEWEAFHALGAAFAERFAEAKRSRSAYLMADLEFLAVSVVRSHPELAGAFSEAWDYWMIDEYQDTSPLQVECLRALIGSRPCYRVGDPQQSIYLFRGAEVRVFDEAESEVRERGGEVRELAVNYRSSPDLLEWINDFMSALGPFARMSPRESVSGGERICAKLIRAPDASAEVEAVVARVAELIDDGARLEEICVLGRTHRNLMDMAAGLREYGYPTHVHSSRGFQSRREVADARALWKFLVNPHDNTNLVNLLRSPWFYVDDWRLVEIMAARPASLWRELTKPGFGKGPEAVGRLSAALDRARTVGLAHAFEETLVAAGLIDLCLVQDPAGRKESNLWKLIAQARDLEATGGASALDLGGDASDLDPDGGASDGDATSAQEPGCLNLMTIHGSKGLEFEHVILPRAGESPNTGSTREFEVTERAFHFPIRQDEESEFVASPLDRAAIRRQTAREREEFDRWLYVALTRARRSLTVTCSEIGPGSWAARSPWFGQEAGRHVRSSYCYEVVDKWETPSFRRVSDVLKRSPRELWGRTQASHGRQSVTSMISSPSHGHAGTTDLAPVQRRLKARAAGIDLHRRLERLRYERPDALAPSVESDRTLAFVMALHDPPMAELARSGHAEWGFQIRTGIGVVEGQIDLWGKSGGVLHVLDYKSGSEDHVEDAFAQLDLYAWALRKFGHTEPIRLSVVYPLSERVVARPYEDSSFERREVEFGGAETAR